MAAIQAGDYAAAHEALLQLADLDPTIRAGIGAFLLALTERFDEAEQVLRDADLPALQVIVRGERQRLTRWRDPAANGSLTATTEIAAIPLHVAVACAFVHDNEDLASQAKLRLAAGDPITGQLTLQTGETRRFKDITDSDDAIGRMLETYCGDGLLYFPFASLRRIEVLPKTSYLRDLDPDYLDKLRADLKQAQLFVRLEHERNQSPVAGYDYDRNWIAASVETWK